MSDGPHLFTVPLDAYNGKIPFIVSDIINELKKRHSEKVEGIFRLNGSDSRIKELISELDKGPISNWDLIKDIHTLSTTLKRYFREMTETRPIIPFEIYDKLIQTDEDNDTAMYTKIKPIIQGGLIPKQNMLILAFVFEYLYSLSLFKEENQMSPKNLSICFTPNLLVPKDPSPNMMSESLTANRVVELMVANYKDLFGSIKIEDSDFCTEEDIGLLLKKPIDMNYLHILINRFKIRSFTHIPVVQFCQKSKNPRYMRPTIEPPIATGISNKEPINRAQSSNTINFSQANRFSAPSTQQNSTLNTGSVSHLASNPPPEPSKTENRQKSLGFNFGGGSSQAAPEPYTANTKTITTTTITNEPNASAPTYRQPSYSPPLYGQQSSSPPLYGQQSSSPPMYGQPSYSPPSYGQPSYSPPSYGQPSYSPPSYGQPSYAPQSSSYGSPSLARTQPEQISQNPPPSSQVRSNTSTSASRHSSLIQPSPIAQQVPLSPIDPNVSTPKAQEQPAPPRANKISDLIKKFSQSSEDGGNAPGPKPLNRAATSGTIPHSYGIGQSPLADAFKK